MAVAGIITITGIAVTQIRLAVRSRKFSPAIIILRVIAQAQIVAQLLHEAIPLLPVPVRPRQAVVVVVKAEVVFQGRPDNRV